MKTCKVTSVKKVSKSATVCDITVADNHNLLVCSKISEKPVLAHNCALLQHLYPMKIKGWMLAYLSRDNPQNMVVVGGEFSEDDHKKQLAKLKRYDRHFGTAISFDSIDEIKMLAQEKPCKDEAFYNKHYANPYSACPLAESKLCWNPSLPKKLKSAFASRKCIPLIPVK